MAVTCSFLYETLALMGDQNYNKYYLYSSTLAFMVSWSSLISSAGGMSVRVHVLMALSLEDEAGCQRFFNSSF